MIPRAYEPLEERLAVNKALVIFGPRRVGKTTLLKKMLDETKLNYKLDSGDNIRTQQVLGSQDFEQILAYAEGYSLIAIDEAQNIANVGMGIKILLDQFPGLRVIVTGSSSFELAGQLGEPLTGRKTTLTLYPIAQSELLMQRNQFELRESLSQFLVYGAYPEIIQAATNQDRIDLLMEIANSYLLKDILAFDRIKSSRNLLDLLKLLAYQVGEEVSLTEVSTQLGVDVKTVKRYLDLLEKSFVVFRMNGFSRNLRQEVTNKAKYYFYDNGIRNAIISQFNPVADRNDVGALWENFLQVERLKHRQYSKIYGNMYFWRTYQQQKIDLIEEREGNLFAYEFKWSSNKGGKVPSDWTKTYPNASYQVIHPNNYWKFIA
jgi:predicted AAA+ superfamily ATPase